MSNLATTRRRAALYALVALSTLFAAGVSLARQAGARSPSGAESKADPQAQASPPDFARVRATLAGHAGDIIEISFSPDGSTLATGAEDGTVRLWDARTGAAESVLRLARALDWVSIKWNADGTLLATDWASGLAAHSDHVRVWDARGGRALCSVSGHGRDVTSVEWSPDGSRLVTASADGVARVWDARTCAATTTVVLDEPGDASPAPPGIARARAKTDSDSSVRACFTADGRQIVVAGESSAPRLYDLATASGSTAPRLFMSGVGNRCAPRPASPAGEPSYVADGVRYYFSPDGRRIVTFARGGYPSDKVRLELWDSRAGSLLRAYDALPSFGQLYLSDDGGHLVLVGNARTQPRVIDMASGQVFKLPFGGCTSDSLWHDPGCEPFVFNADGRVTLRLDGQIKLFSTEDGALLDALADTDRRAAFSPTDPRLLAARSKDKRSVFLLELALK